jgi:hypothetical protein
MFNGWLDGLLVGIKTINNILTAGIAITAFSLFLYALSFNLRDRVARSFAIILLCVVVVFTTEALQNKSIPDWGTELLLRLQWVGIIFLPPHAHLSDALLVTAGAAWAQASKFALLCGLSDFLVSHRNARVRWYAWTTSTAFARTLTDFFIVYYMAIMVWPGKLYTRLSHDADVLNTVDAFLEGSEEGVRNLFGSGPAVSAFLLPPTCPSTPSSLWRMQSCFGVSWPDRVVKSRLFKWLLRGPVAASLALGMMTIVRRAGVLFEGQEYSAFVPLTVVVTVLMFEHAVTLFSPIWEKLLFFGRDHAELQLLQNIEERLPDAATCSSSLKPCSQHYASSAIPRALFCAMDGAELTLSVVPESILLEKEDLDEALEIVSHNVGETGHEFTGWFLDIASAPAPDER